VGYLKFSVSGEFSQVLVLVNEQVGLYVYQNISNTNTLSQMYVQNDAQHGRPYRTVPCCCA
jgi:hypothetical protein